MVELRKTRAGVAGCFAAPEALDALAVEDALVLRVAPDEAMLILGPAALGAAVTEAAAQLRKTDEDGVVLDVTEGWRVVTLGGEAARDTFARLSALRLDAGASATQGDVARVPAKVVATPEAIHVLVPAMLEAHVRGRVLAACSDLDVRLVPRPVDWVTPDVPSSAGPGAWA